MEFLQYPQAQQEFFLSPNPPPVSPSVTVAKQAGRLSWPQRRRDAPTLTPHHQGKHFIWNLSRVFRCDIAAVESRSNKFIE